MDYFSTISKVMDYTDDDLKDKDKYNEYTKALYGLGEAIDNMPFAKSLINNIFDTDFIAGIDDLLAHADDVYSRARREENDKAKKKKEITLAPSKPLSLLKSLRLRNWLTTTLNSQRSKSHLRNRHIISRLITYLVTSRNLSSASKKFFIIVYKGLIKQQPNTKLFYKAFIQI